MSKEKRVGLISTYSFDPDGLPSGVTDHARQLAVNLERRNCQPTLIGYTRVGDESVVRIGRLFPTTIGIAGTNYRPVIFRSEKRAEQIIKAGEFDLLHLQELLASPTMTHAFIEADRALGRFKPVPRKQRQRNQKLIPVVGTFHAQIEDLKTVYKAFKAVGNSLKMPTVELDPKCRIDFKESYLSTIYDIDAGIYVSGRTFDSALRFKPELQEKPARIIPNGIDTNELTLDFDKKPKPGERQKLLFPGRIEARKDPYVAVKAVAILLNRGVDINIEFTGKGKDEKKLKDLVESLGIEEKVVFNEQAPDRQALIDKYQSANLVIASSAWGEGFNRVIAEAGACGTDVVASDNNTHLEVYRDAPFVTFAKKGDASDFAVQIDRRLAAARLKNKSVLVEHGKKSHDWVEENFSWERVAEDTDNYYEEVIEMFDMAEGHEYYLAPSLT